MNIKNPEIAILCGGFGIRMGKLTSKKQKSMLKVEGRPILEHLLDQISIAFSRAKITLLVGYDSKSIYDYFGKRYKKLQLEYTSTSTEGIRLALLTAKDFIKGDNFLIVPGDIIVRGSELLNLVNAADIKKPNLLGTMLLSAEKEKAPTHGIVTIRNHRVLKIEYPPARSVLGRHMYISMGTEFYSRRLFDKLETCIVSDIAEVLIEALKEGEQIEGEICTTPWFHFASPKDLKTHIEF